uniref:PDZ domain-containing protein n=1 Tax=Petromyzon marinus TaxID=7757 RepID=S4RGR7_PETMA
VFLYFCRDKDYHLKTYKSVIMAYKLIDWLVSQQSGKHGECTLPIETMFFLCVICNRSLCHHLLEKSEFKDDSLLFRFYADEDAEGLSGGMSRKLSRSVSLRVDFKVVENIIGKTLLIKPSKGGFGFEIEDKNNQAIVKSVERGSYAEMAGMRVGKKVYAVNGDPVFLRSFAEVEALLRESHHGRLHLRVLLATKPRETIKVSSCAEGLGFQIRGCGPSVVHAVGRGTAAAGAGLQPGQCIVKVNGSNVSKASHASVIAHVTAFRSQRQAPQQEDVRWVYSSPAGLSDGETERRPGGGGGGGGGNCRLQRLYQQIDNVALKIGEGEGVSLTVDNTQLEYGVAYEFERTAGMRCHVLEKMSEPRGMFLLAAQELKWTSRSVVRFTVRCLSMGQCRSMRELPVTKVSQWTRVCVKLISHLCKRVNYYFKFARTLRNKAWPTFKQAKPRTPSLHGSDFCPTNCHLNVLEVSYPRDSTVLGSSLGVRTERPKSRIDPDALAAASAHLSGEGGEQAVGKLSPMVYVQHCVGTMGAPWGRSSSSRTPHGARDVGAPTRDAWTQLLAKIEGVMREIHRGSAQVQRYPLSSKQFAQSLKRKYREVAAGGNVDGGKGDAERPRKVSFEVLKEEQEDSGHDTATSNRDSYSDCPSHRNSVMSLTSYCGSQRCSSLLSDDVDSAGEESPDTLSLAMDRHERLQGCLEHLFAQVETLTKVMGGAVACSAFEKTKHLTPELTFQAFQQEVELSVSVADMIQLQVQHDLATLSRNLHTIIHSVTR